MSETESEEEEHREKEVVVMERAGRRSRRWHEACSLIESGSYSAAGLLPGRS